MFRKEFALLGLVFGLFVYGSIAFPDGVIQSSIRGTANIPTAESLGGWGAIATLMFIMTAGIILVVAATSLLALLMKQKNLREVAEAYGVDADSLAGMTPMEAYQMLSEQYAHNVVFEKGEAERHEPAFVSRGMYIRPAYANLKTEPTA